MVCYAEENNFPRWSKDRESYLFDGNLTGKNMRELLPNEVLIEFDKKTKITKSLVREESLYWINKIKDVFETRGIKFHITDHQGLSPHLRFCIDGLEDYEPWIRSEYKKRLVNSLFKTIHFDSDLVQLDQSFFHKSPKLIPLENAIHWKNKYHTREEIIYDNPGEPFKVRQKQIDRIKKSATRSTPKKSLSCAAGLSIPRLEECFLKHYVEGQRHYVLTGWTTMMQKKGFDRKYTKDVFNKISENLERQEGKKDFMDIDNEYDKDMKLEDKSAVHMFEIAYGDRDDAFDCYLDFQECFIAPGDDL